MHGPVIDPSSRNQSRSDDPEPGDPGFGDPGFGDSGFGDSGFDDPRVGDPDTGRPAPPLWDGVGPGTVLGVLGGCGGAGASTLAAVVAARAARTVPTFLIDLDTTGGGIDLLLGSEDEPGPRWSDVRIRGGGIDPEALQAALPKWCGVAFLAADNGRSIEPEAATAVIEAASVAGLVVIDVPRWPSPMRTEVLGSLDAVVVLAPAEVRAVAASALAVRGLAEDTAALVVRSPSRALPAGRLADALGLPLIATLGDDPAAADPDGLDLDRLRRATLQVADLVLARALVPTDDRRHADPWPR